MPLPLSHTTIPPDESAYIMYHNWLVDRQYIACPVAGHRVYLWYTTSLFHYYRATFMHSADFAVARCLSVHLSVCPSICHMPVLSLNGYTYPQSFSPSYIPTILVFPHEMRWQYSDGEPPNGGIECKGVWNNHDFPTISRFISQMMQDGAIVTMEGK